MTNDSIHPAVASGEVPALEVYYRGDAGALRIVMCPSVALRAHDVLVAVAMMMTDGHEDAAIRLLDEARAKVGPKTKKSPCS